MPEIQVPNAVANKVQKESLQNLPQFELDGANFLAPLETGLYSFTEEGFKYDFLFSKARQPEHQGRLFVLFSGSVDRNKMTLPVFQRWSWARFFPGHTLYVADPGLALAKSLWLAWYAGTKDVEFLPVIAKCIRQVAEGFNILERDIFSYGSSGGGFAALKLLRYLPDMTAIVINPQTDIYQYLPSSVNSFLRHCFGQTDRDIVRSQYPGRFSVVEDADFILRRKVVYAQNTCDEFHLQGHLAPLLQARGLDPENHGLSNLHISFFADERGHGAGEPKELFPKLIASALKLG